MNPRIPAWSTPILLLAAATAMPTAPAQPVDPCTGPNEEPGIILDAGDPSTGCTYICTDSALTLGANATLDNQPILACDLIAPCPLFGSTGIILNGRPYCYTPAFTNCPEGYIPLPLQVAGVPAWPSPLLLCLGPSLEGCPDGQVGITIIWRHNGSTTGHPLCV